MKFFFLETFHMYVALEYNVLEYLQIHALYLYCLPFIHTIRILLQIMARFCLVAGVKRTVTKLNVQYCHQLPSDITASITDYKQHVNFLLVNACL